jgi:hypothetical protein
LILNALIIWFFGRVPEKENPGGKPPQPSLYNPMQQIWYEKTLAAV